MPSQRTSGVSLIERWPTLRQRLNEHREFLLWRQQFAGRLEEWSQAGQDLGALLWEKPLDNPEN